MKQRYELTEDEGLKLLEVGNDFWEKLGKLVAEAVNKMPKALEGATMVYLNDRSSVYGSAYDNHLDESRP